MTRSLQSIERFRKAEATVRVCEESGRRVAAAHVSVEQESHAFAFGCVLPDLRALTDAERNRLTARVAEIFNLIAACDDDVSDDGRFAVADLTDATDRMHLARLTTFLDAHAADDRPLRVLVSGKAVGLGQPGADDQAPASDERDVALRVADFYALCFSHPAVRGIVWKGVWDRAAGPGCGLLRDDLAPKRALKHLQKLVHVVWHTRAAGQTDAEGEFTFRGFFGTYRVVVSHAGQAPVIAKLELREGDEQNLCSVVAR